ncbi:hypothetical protein FK522_27780, partial [Klebsiella pneumoniae]|nr:hypothetical protein [Klebsiella pneumoniae]
MSPSTETRQLKCCPAAASSRSTNAVAEAGSGPSGGDQLETRVIQVQHTSAAELIPLIRPLVPQYGHL